MKPMPVVPQRHEMFVRVGRALLAGGLIGLERSESGKAAGLRTTILVCLAACLSMLPINALLPQAGKPQGAFPALDPMRLPLGLLTGMGFIGAREPRDRADLRRVGRRGTAWVRRRGGMPRRARRPNSDLYRYSR